MELLEEIRSGNRLAKWNINPIDFGLFICFVFMGSFLLSGLFVSGYAYLIGGEPELESLPIVIASGFGLQLSSVLAWLLFKFFVTYESEDRPDSFKKSVKIGVVGFICIYLALIPSMLVWKALLDALQFEYEYQLPVLLVQGGGSPLEMSLMALLIVVVAPICEEIVYRGFLFRYLNRRVSLGVAIAISSGIFALMHLNLYSFLPLFILGGGLCLAYRLSGSIVSSITIHVLFNLVNLLMIFFVEPIQL